MRRKHRDDFVNAAKLNFVDREKRILWVTFSRKMADVRGEDALLAFENRSSFSL
jgi:hypothetical protein